MTMTDSELLNKALDYIVEREKDDDRICEAMDNTWNGVNYCAHNCTGLNRQCVTMYLETIYQKEASV